MKEHRGIIQNKEPKPDNKRSAWQACRFWLPVLCAGVMAAGMMALRSPSETAGTDSSEPPSGHIAENNPTAVFEENPDRIGANAMEPAAVSAENAHHLASKATVPSAADPFSGASVPEAPVVPLISDRMAETNVPARPALAEQSRKPFRIEIHEMVSCSGVNNRQYDSPKTVFSLKEDSKSVVWMNVLSDNPPFTLTHIYYVNGRRYCAVPLEIRHPRMRTWSYVTLRGQDHQGKWRVEVVTDEGEKLDQVEFTVLP